MATPKMAASSCTDAWTGKHLVVLLEFRYCSVLPTALSPWLSRLCVMGLFQMSLFVQMFVL